nr:hypothetical protein [Streptococcus thoraltensis]
MLLLDILDLAQSSYYYHLKQLNQADKDRELKTEITVIYDEHKETMATVGFIWK